MTQSLKISFSRITAISQQITLSRSKYLGRLKVTLGQGDDKKTFYGSHLIKNALNHLQKEQHRAGALSILSRLKRLQAPNPETWLARICQKIARVFSADALTKLRRNPQVESTELDEAVARVKANPEVLANMDEEFRNNRQVVLAAVRKSGLALQFASEAFHEDREVVLAAVRQNGFALQFASTSLRHDSQIIAAAMATNPDVLLTVECSL